MDPILLRQFIDHYVGGLRDAQRYTGESQKHHDDMLTWSIGLMGAGLFYVHGKITTGGVPLGLMPWIAGILVAVLARVIGSVVRDLDYLAQFAKIHGLLALLLIKPDEPGLPNALDAVIKNKGELGEKFKTVRHLNIVSTTLALIAHAFLGIGIVTALWTLG